MGFMNIHHLELFYFVAKHGGIAAAVRNIPYGIQQPAVSGQIAKLEESLGTKLFQRRPFALSPTGTELFEFIRPLLELPLILLVHKKSKLTRAEELWKRDKIEETLVCFSRSDPVHAHFQRGLERFGVEWFCGIEVTSERLIQHYVASGYGIGLTVAVPGFRPPPPLRALPLSDFPPVVVGVAWSGKLPNIARQLLAELDVEATTQRARIGKIAIRGDFFQSRSALSICLICSRNSGVFWCPCAETACCTAASSTSSSVPEILIEQFFSLG